MKKREQVMVAVPSLDGRCETALMVSLLQLQCVPELSLGFSVTNGGVYIGHVRNVMATRVLESNFDSILFVDSDMSFDAKQLASMVLLGEDIVGGVYHYKRKDRKMVNNPARSDSGEMQTSRNGRLSLADWAGTGAMRIRRQVLETLAKTVETYSPGPGAGNEPSKIYNFFPTGIRRTYLGEDVGFCRIAADAGFKIWIDSECRCNHHGTISFPI